jgi:hypothetical protein
VRFHCAASIKDSSIQMAGGLTQRIVKSFWRLGISGSISLADSDILYPTLWLEFRSLVEL